MSLFPLRLIPHTTNFNFMRVRWVSIGIAALLAIAAIGAIVVKNFNFALDFTGGTVVELRFQTPPNVDGVRERLEAGGYGSAQVQTFGTGSDLLVRLQPREDAGTAAGAEASDRTAQDVLRLASSEGNQATVMRSEFVGPQVGKELALNGLYTLLFVVVGFLIYIAVRFEWKFAVSAIVTTLADVLIVAGFFAFSGIEFDLTILAGLLSVMGFSINDKIVVFDRVRENLRKYRKMDMISLLDLSTNETLSRTVMTSLTVLMALMALLLIGPGVIFGFTAAMTLGLFVGCYSSIYMANPILVWLGVGPHSFVPQQTEADKAEAKLKEGL